MSEVYFNELSLINSILDISILKEIAECKSSLSKKGYNICRLSYEDYVNLISKIDAIPTIKKTHRDLVFSFFKPPYTSENQTQESFDNNQYSYNEFHAPKGLSLAAVLDGISFSLLTDNQWDESFILLESNDSKIPVKHLSRATHIDDWIDLLTPIQIIETNINPNKKNCHISGDHHGKGELKKFWKIIKYCNYVEECRYSLPFQPNCKSFATVKSDCTIDLVLLWEQPCFGINIKTTARNKREAEKIAEFISDKYGHP